ncbi:MAG: PadR family transcriptional regulator [Peptococcaceae bacterium]|nr:PadR family transcriptional regulator [Peptococcaceae bacterium]
MAESFDRGALTEAVFYILLSLHQPMHGYAIMQNIDKLTAGRVVLGPGTLYGAINALVQKKWIIAVSAGRDSRKKEYIISETGKTVLRRELERLRELLSNGENVGGESTHEDQ